MALNKGIKNVLTGLAVLLVPGAGVVVGGVLIYKGIKKLTKKKVLD